VDRFSDPFCDAIVSDLAEFSRELLAPGAAPSKRYAKYGKSLGIGVTATAQLNAADRLVRQVPRLLEAADIDDTLGAFTYVPKPYSRDAATSTRPTRFDRVQGKIVPVEWLAAAPSGQPAIAPLAWLTHLIQQQLSELRTLETRIQKQVDDAILARQGTSEYAQTDLQNLKLVLAPVTHGLRSLEATLPTICSYAGVRRIAPCQRRPDPYPLSPVWRAFRSEIQDLLAPVEVLPDLVGELLASPIAAADIPYLYQRWVGLKIFRAMETHGWRMPANAAGVLFLGGGATFKEDRFGVEVTVWVEPRLDRKLKHPSGFNAYGTGEAAPDFLIITPGHGGDDAFVIDATKTADEETVKKKGKYLTMLVGESPIPVAGKGILRLPRRSWAASPLRAKHCEFFDSVGTTGVVPMHPAAWNPQPIFSWIQDISEHALAWGK